MSEKEQVITIKKESLWKYSTFILAALLIVVLFAWLGDNDGKDGRTTGQAVGNVPPQLPPPSGAAATVDDDPVLGDKDAPVTIIEFSDYECPFCGRNFRETYPLLKKNYIDTGKVKLVYRDFPLNFHPMAVPAAVAANCVRENGGDSAYWKMHDRIFENQQSLSNENLKKWAKDLGHDIGNCLDSGKYKEEVQKDVADGSAAGVKGTPSFFINGRQLEGAQPYAVFQQAIEAELA